jgi:hypothetical protein
MELRMRSHLLLAGLAVILVSTQVLLAAEPPLLTCQFYARGQASTPASVADFAKKFDDSLSRACINPRGRVLFYDSVDDVVHAPNGVCFYDRFERLAAGRPASDETRTFMSYSPNAACPAQSAREYVMVEGVSPGVFLSILGFLKGISEGAAEFDRAVSISIEQEASVRPSLNGFRTRLLDLNGRPILYAATVGRLVGHEDTLAHVLTFEDPRDPAASHSVAIDLTPDGWKIMDYEMFRITSFTVPR